MKRSDTKQYLLNDKDLRTLVWRSLPLEASWHYERQQHLGFAFMMMSALRKIYKDQPDKYREALQRHVREFYNTSPQATPFIAGLVCSMEEENAKKDSFDTSAISAIKAALIGPAAGIFDAIFLSTLRILGVAIGTGFCLQGNPVGVLIYFLMYNVPAFICRFGGVKIGYHTGANFIARLESSGLMEKFRYAASLIAMMAFGSMTKDYVYINFALSFGPEKSATTLQSILDGVMPGLAGLAVVWLYWYFITKKKIGIMLLLLLTIVLCIGLAYFKILSA